MTENPAPLNRRSFLISMAWKGLGIVAAAEFIWMTAAYFVSGRKRNGAARVQLHEAGPAVSFGTNTVTAFPGGRFYLARQADGGFIALSMRCTHLGCAVTWEENMNRFVCPCHSSVFTLSGEVLNPPASRALSYYPVLIENGIVKVDLGTVRERNTFRKEQLTYAP